MAIAPIRVSGRKPLAGADKHTYARSRPYVQYSPHRTRVYRGEKQLFAYTSHHKEVCEVESVLLDLQTVSSMLPPLWRSTNLVVWKTIRCNSVSTLLSTFSIYARPTHRPVEKHGTVCRAQLDTREY